MKKLFKTMMAVATMVAAMSMVSCGEKNPKEGLDIIENEGTHFALYYNSQKITPLDTLVYDITLADRQNDLAIINLVPENLTSGELSTSQKCDMLEGDNDMANLEICGGGTCPWNGQPYTTVPGMNTDKPIAFDVHPSEHTAGHSALYRVAIGVGEKIEHATVVYLRINL